MHLSSSRLALLVPGMALPLIALVLAIFPLATNDGPVHIAFSSFLNQAGNSSLEAQLYARNETSSANRLGYWLIALFLEIGSPRFAESVLQLLCLLAPGAAAVFALRQIDKDRQWLALVVLVLSLNQLFFLGLYNFQLSAAAFLLVLGGLLWMHQGASLARTMVPVAGLCMAFAAHASGFIASTIAIVTLAMARFLPRYDAGYSLSHIAGDMRKDLVTVAAAIPLGLLLLSSGGASSVRYGVPFVKRLHVLFGVKLLGVHSYIEKLIGVLLGGLLYGGVALALYYLFRKRFKSEVSALPTLVVVLLVLALAFPDTLGGGWTHFSRMGLFPVLVAPLCLALLPMSRVVQTGLALFISGCMLVMLANTYDAQRAIKAQLAPLDAIDTLVGAQCSVLPVVFEAKRLDGGTGRDTIFYDPFFHAATRLEHSKDRIVLFNFLARLDVYPVKFRAGHDPQQLIFHWKPYEQDTRVDHLDIQQFETRTGIGVDYILRWGKPSLERERLRAAFADATRGTELVYQSADRQVALFRRLPGGRSRCGDSLSVARPAA